MEQQVIPAGPAGQPMVGNRLAVWGDRRDRTLSVHAESRQTWPVGAGDVEAFLRTHSCSEIACCSAAELYDFARFFLGGATSNAVWEAIRVGRVNDLTLRDHAAALARNGLIARPRRWADIVRDHPDLRPDLIESDAGGPPDGRRAAAAVWRLAYEARPPLGDLSGLRVHAIHTMASVVLRMASFSPPRIDPGRLSELLVRLKQRRDRLAKQLLSDQRIRNCFKLSDGRPEPFNSKGFLVPREGKLRQWLSTVSGRFQDQVGRTVMAPQLGKTVSTAPPDWLMFAPMDDMLAAWVEVDAVCRLAQEVPSEPTPEIWTAYTVLPWVRATSSTLSDLSALAGVRCAAPPPGRGWMRVVFSDVFVAALALRWEQRTGHSSLADIIREGRQATEWAAARLLGVDDDQFSALAQANPTDHARWVRLAANTYRAAALGLPAKAGRYIAEQVCQDDAFVRQAEPSLRRLYEELHPDMLDYLRRVPNPDDARDGAWASQTGSGVWVVGLNCMTARRIDYGTAADDFVQRLIIQLAANAYTIVQVMEDEVLIETEGEIREDAVAAVQELVDQATTSVFGPFPVRCRVSPVASF